MTSLGDGVRTEGELDSFKLSIVIVYLCYSTINTVCRSFCLSVSFHQDLRHDTKHGYIWRLTPNDLKGSIIG